MADSPNVRAIRSTTPSFDAGQSSATSNTGVDSNLSNNFSELQNQKSEMRSGEQSNVNSYNSSVAQLDNTTRQANQVTQAIQGANQEFANQNGIADEARTTASLLTNRAATLERLADSTPDKGKRMTLKMEANRLREQARREEENSLQARERALGELASIKPLSEKQGDLQIQAGSFARNADSSQTQKGTLNQNLGQVDVALNRVQTQGTTGGTGGGRSITQTSSVSAGTGGGNSGGATVVTPGIGGGFTSTNPFQQFTNPFVATARAIMSAISQVNRQSLFDINAIFQLAIRMAIKTLAQQGKTVTEEGMAVEVAGGGTASHELRLLDAQFNTTNAEAETSAKDWERRMDDNFKKSDKSTQDAAKRA